MTWTPQQTAELERLARRDRRAYVRTKALALLNAARGRTYTEIGATLQVHRETVGRWVKRFGERGVASLFIAPGRGRKAQGDLREVAAYVRQSPRQFGLAETRWTLRTLAETVPSLRGMTESGVYRTLERAGVRYKRGQPVVHSPDPAYGEKRGAWSRRSARRPVARRRLSSSLRTR